MYDTGINIITSSDLEHVKYRFLFFTKSKTKNDRTLLPTLLP